MIRKTKAFQDWVKNPWGPQYSDEVLPFMESSPVGSIFVMKIGYILKNSDKYAYIVMPKEVEDAAYEELRT